MTNLPEGWTHQLHAALQKLNQSEMECARVAANYAEFESIIRKRSQVHLPDKTESETSSVIKESRPATSGGRKSNSKNEYKSRPVVTRQANERPPLRRSTEDAVPSFQQTQINQIQKRLKQYYKNKQNIKDLSNMAVPEKQKFLKYLEKWNSEMWSSRSKNPLLTKLFAHMDKT